MAERVLTNLPRIVIDTNVLLVSISGKSEYHWIFQYLLAEKFRLVISNEILTEYEEVISNKFSKETALNVIRTLLFLPNVETCDIYYNWSLITSDEDDNKFVDCAVASNAHVIVSNDKHFKHLNEITFPPVMVIGADEFKSFFSD